VKTPKPVGFFRKFFELQLLMLQHNAGLTASHPYASAPINWPFLLSGISFWTQNEGQKQIYLIGNIVGWWTCALALSLYVGILGADLLAKRRGINPIPIGKLAIVERYCLVLTKDNYSRSQSPMELCRLFRDCLARPLFPILPHESTTIHSPLSPLASCIGACRWRSASFPPV
jgi:C-terminal four TMM region of protein-O-mannosyltransferase